MKRLLLPLLALVLAIPIKAEISNKVHNRCKDAKDYLGCVKAMTIKSTDIPSLRMIQGKTELTGNSCPSGYVYIGAGNCRSIEKSTSSDFLTVDGVGLYSAGHVSKPVWHTYYKLTELTKAISDPNCPDKEPFLYTSSSCYSRPEPPTSKEIRKFMGLVDGNRKTKRDIWNNKFKEIYGIENLVKNAYNE